MRQSILMRLAELESKVKPVKPSVAEWETSVLVSTGLTREEIINQFGSFPRYAYHLMLHGNGKTDELEKSPSGCGSALERYKAMLNG